MIFMYRERAPAARRDKSVGGRRRRARSASTIAADFDGRFPTTERLPRQFRIAFNQRGDPARPRVVLYSKGHRVGDELTDNSYTDDGYRFHDVFHFGFAALLGWSPMTRKLFGCKRRSDPLIDEVEDGGRARVLEEAVCAIVYDYARRRRYLAGVRKIDRKLLETVKSLIADREVRARSARDWERAILRIYEVWRQMWRNEGGTLRADLVRRRLEYSRQRALFSH
jgi:hypothetical protein